MRLKIDIKRFVEEPIIKPFHNHEIGFNVQGPSLIKVPEWIKDPLGIYYLYFADHKGDRINLAYSSNLRGPWNIYNGGVLHLNESNFLTLKPKVPEDFDLNTLEQIDVHDDLKEFIPDKIDDFTIPHIASPDAHVDDENKRILYVMPKSIGDVYMSTALFKDIKNTYPDYNLYVATEPQNFEILDGNPYIHKVIPYISAMDQLPWLEGTNNHKGYFEVAFLPYIGTQRMFDYQHNGKDKISLDLCTF